MLTPVLVRGLDLFFIATLLAALANMTAPKAQAASPVDDTANTAYNTLVTINVLANDIDDLDAIFANYGQANRVCYGDGAGGFTCSDVSADTNQSADVALGDLNGDGDLDVIFANIGQLKRVCLGNGAGGFTGCADVGGVRNSTEVALGLVKGDGNLDAVLANNGDLNRVMWGDGTGGFSGGSNVGAGARRSFGVALGDLNGDSNLDVVFANNGDRNRRCLGDGAGGLNCINASADTNSSRGVALGNINNTVDSYLDAVFANAGQPNRGCLGDAAGNFTGGCADVSGDTNDTRGVALGDLNGDGNLDAVFANGTDQQNRRCLGDAAGNFTGGCADVSGDTNRSLAVALGDLNGDGDLDAVFANRGQVNRRCLGNGAGGFACADVSADTNNSRGVALGLLGLDVSSVAVTIAPANGAAVVNPDGSITYTPDPGFSGVDTFTYSVEGSTATVTVNVGAPPIPVGGIIVPVNKFELLAPWLGLAALASLAALTVALVRRRIA